MSMTVTITPKLHGIFELEDAIAASSAIRKPSPAHCGCSSGGNSQSTSRSDSKIFDDETNTLLNQYEQINLTPPMSSASSSYSSSSPNNKSTFSQMTKIAPICTGTAKIVSFAPTTPPNMPNASITVPPRALGSISPRSTPMYRSRQMTVQFMHPESIREGVPVGYMDDDTIETEGVVEQKHGQTKVIIPNAAMYEPTGWNFLVFSYIPSLVAIRDQSVRCRDAPVSYAVQATAAMKDLNGPDKGFTAVPNWWLRASHTEVENAIRYTIVSRVLPIITEDNESLQTRKVLRMKLKYLTARMQFQDSTPNCKQKARLPRDRMLKMITELNQEKPLSDLVWCWECKEYHSPFDSLRIERTNPRHCNQTRTPGAFLKPGLAHAFGRLSASMWDSTATRTASTWIYPFQTRIIFPMVSSLMKAHTNREKEKVAWLARQMSTTDTWTAPDGTRIQISQRTRILPRLESRTEALHSEIKFVLIPRSHSPGEIASDGRLLDLARLAYSVLPTNICPHVQSCSTVGSAFPAWMELADRGFQNVNRPLRQQVVQAGKNPKPKPKTWGPVAKCAWSCCSQPCDGIRKCGAELGLRQIRSCPKCWTDWSVAAVDLQIPHMDKATIQDWVLGKRGKGLKRLSCVPRSRRHTGRSLNITKEHEPKGKTRALVLTVRKDLGRGFDPETDRRWLASEGLYGAKNIIPGDVFVGWETNGLAQPGRAGQKFYDPTVESQNLDRLSKVRSQDWDRRNYYRRAQIPNAAGVVPTDKLDELPWLAAPYDEWAVASGDDSDVSSSDDEDDEE